MHQATVNIEYELYNDRQMDELTNGGKQNADYDIENQLSNGACRLQM